MTQPWIPAQQVPLAAQKWNQFGVGAPLSGFKVWMGASWVLKPVKVWDGSAWVAKPLKRWDGAAWVLCD